MAASSCITNTCWPTEASPTPSRSPCGACVPARLDACSALPAQPAGLVRAGLGWLQLAGVPVEGAFFQEWAGGCGCCPIHHSAAVCFTTPLPSVAQPTRPLPPHPTPPTLQAHVLLRGAGHRPGQVWKGAGHQHGQGDLYQVRQQGGEQGGGSPAGKQGAGWQGRGSMAGGRRALVARALHCSHRLSALLT